MRLGMVINLKRCVGCYACTVACQYENKLPYYEKYCRIHKVGPEGVFPDLTMYNIPLACMHCQDAPCVTACPTGASHKTEQNTVAIDADKCIGCLFCMVSCPYDARHMSDSSKTVEKCNFCLTRVEEGLSTRCTETCQLKARVMGDLDDPHSEVSAIIRRENAQALQPQFGTKPSIYYVMP